MCIEGVPIVVHPLFCPVIGKEGYSAGIRYVFIGYSLVIRMFYVCSIYVLCMFYVLYCKNTFFLVKYCICQKKAVILQII